MILADIEVARACDLGVNDDRLTVRSHLGGQLRPGDHVLGYDLRAVNVGGLDSDAIDGMNADVVLVRKHYQRRKERRWVLQRMEREKEETNGIQVEDEEDMEALRQDLEEDAELRKGVNMYRDPSERPAKAREDEGEEEDDEEDAPEVPLAELLEGLVLGDGA